MGAAGDPMEVDPVAAVLDADPALKKALLGDPSKVILYILAIPKHTIPKHTLINLPLKVPITVGYHHRAFGAADV
jgi:hypothetical protein